MTLISQIGDKVGLFGAMSISHHFNNEANAFISTLQICVFVLLSQTVKSMIREPRPLMVDGTINVEDCKHMEFGNPSSHVYGATFMWITCVYLLCKDYIYKNKIRGAGWRVVQLIHVLFGVLLVLGFSRVYKGVHSYNQVLSGFV
jgi:membrane-associated phospholipid phosphatase